MHEKGRLSRTGTLAASGTSPDACSVYLTVSAHRSGRSQLRAFGASSRNRTCVIWMGTRSPTTGLSTRMERVAGIGPAITAWKAVVLPLAPNPQMESASGNAPDSTPWQGVVILLYDADTTLGLLRLYNLWSDRASRSPI